MYIYKVMLLIVIMFPSAAINYLTKKFCVKHWKPLLESAIGQRGMRDTQNKRGCYYCLCLLPRI